MARRAMRGRRGGAWPPSRGSARMRRRSNKWMVVGVTVFNVALLAAFFLIYRDEHAGGMVDFGSSYSLGDRAGEGANVEGRVSMRELSTACTAHVLSRELPTHFVQLSERGAALHLTFPTQRTPPPTGEEAAGEAGGDGPWEGDEVTRAVVEVVVTDTDECGVPLWVEGGFLHAGTRSKVPVPPGAASELSVLAFDVTDAVRAWESEGGGGAQADAAVFELRIVASGRRLAGVGYTLSVASAAHPDVRARPVFTVFRGHAASDGGGGTVALADGDAE